MSYSKRSEIPAQYTWDKTAIFKTPEDWEKALKEIEALIPAFAAYKGKLNNKETILEYLLFNTKHNKKIGLVYLYAFLGQDEDSKNTEAQTRWGRVMSMFAKLGEATSFADPEISANSKETLEDMIADPRFSDYDVSLKMILKGKDHILSAEEERIIASFSSVLGNFKAAFDRLDNGDIKWAKVTVDGKKVPLSHGVYSQLLHNPDQKVRADAFKKYYKGYIDVINTLSSLYASQVKVDWTRARTRKFGSTMESALFYEDVDKKVYENLIRCINKNLEPLHDYIALRKEVLGLKTLNMYDLYVPMIENADIKLEFDDAYGLVKKALAPLGKDYVKVLEQARKERWIDVYETPGKRSGAYSIGMQGVHPFVLLNYQQTTNDISTIAHEMGHAMHSYYSNGTQPEDKADYKIFVAEVASTCNEVLLLKYLLNTTEDVNVKKYLLTFYLDMLRTTMYRQAMFAEFEYISHSMEEKGETLTYENLCKEYLKLNKKYYGKAVRHNKEIAYEWARVPHFYRAFYVYKYSTGIISAVCIAEKILREGKSAVANYRKFLTLGCSMDPVSELKVAGVNLTTNEPFDIVAKSFADTLEELKKLLGK